MNLLLVIVISAAVLLIAYRAYGSLLARLFRLDPNARTPAEDLRDDVDYIPTKPQFLLGQHFSAIAAAGPIVGPILAGVIFGWLPALVWIILGCIFIGGVHDFASLVASIRHKARSIAEIVRDHMSGRAYVLLLLFVWIALIYIIVAFTDIVASSFVGVQSLEDGTAVSGGGIATSSLMYLALPVFMAVLMRHAKLPLMWATVIFLPLTAAAVVAGQSIPFDLAAMLGWEHAATIKLWSALLLAYCVIASVLPMWLLLQPRGHLGGWFLYIAVVSALLGILLGGHRIEYPAFTDWVVTSPGSATAESLFPVLFITVACGACSGFHCLIASGTTSKQLRRETDAKLIGYGAMLMEGMVAVVSLACVMMLTKEAAAGLKPNVIYANGVGSFFALVGVPRAIAISFGLLAFTTFVYDTLDVCTRLGRYVVQELTGLSGWGGRWLGTLITAGVPLALLFHDQVDAAGQPIAAWRVFWLLFGASNQLLAALALLGIAVWLLRTRPRKERTWIIPVVGLPAAFMYVMSAWALLRFISTGFGLWLKTMAIVDLPSGPVPWVALVLVILAAWILVEALAVLIRREQPPGGTAIAPA